jgi:thymidylate kinase
MTTTTLSAPDQTLLSGLVDKLGYLPTEADGIQLRGMRNPDGSLRWVWPATLRQPLFLEFYNAASPKARLFARAVKLAFACGVQNLMFPLLPGRYARTGKQSWPLPAFALFTGTPGTFRKAVCCHTDTSGRRFFVKMPLTPAAEERVHAETQALRGLAHRASASFRVPEVVAAHDNYLHQTDVKPAQASRASHLTPRHLAYLHEQLRETAVRRPLAATAFWQTTEAQVSELQGMGETRIPYGLRAKLLQLYHGIDSEQVVPLAFAHGDFTSWNCWLGPDLVALYDLEFAQPEAPLLYDLFHFHVQQGLLVSRRRPAQVREAMWQQARAEFPAIPETELRQAWQLYLLHHVSGYALAYHAQEAWHEQVQWQLAGWNELLTLELAAITEHRQLCLYDFLDSLQPRAGVVLKQRAENAYYPGPTADLDLLVSRPQMARSVAFLRGFPLMRSVVVRRQAHMRSVDCLFQDGTFLSVDLLHQLWRKSVPMMDSAEVLAHARHAAGITVPALRHDFEYTWLFYWLNGSDLPAAHRQHYEQCSPAEQHELLAHLATKYNLYFPSIRAASTHHPALAQELREHLREQAGSGFFRRQGRTLRYAWGVATSFFRPNGFVISFSGVDGAGKSTVIEKVKEHLEKKWRKRVVVLRHRPSVLPILSAWKHGPAEAERRSVARLPRQGSNRSLNSSLARFGYYYLDYLLGQGVVWLKHTSRGQVVLYDRYYFDFINDGERSNIRLPERLTKALYTFVNKPRLNFFLYADPDVILQRKQELSGETIAQLTRKYQTLFGQLAGRYPHSQYVPIENHNLDTTLALIGQYIQAEV